MSNNSFNAGYKTLNTTLTVASVTVDAVKYIPNAFCDLGNMVRSDVRNVADTIASFFAGMHHAARVRSGKCKLLGDK